MKVKLLKGKGMTVNLTKLMTSAAMAAALMLTGCGSTASQATPAKQAKPAQEYAKVGATLYGVKGDAEEAFNEMIEGMEEHGYVLSDPHERINDGYKEKYGTDTLDNLGFFSTAHDSTLRTLLEKHPKLGGFSPFNMHVYKMANEDVTWYGHLNPETMADIVGLKDEAVRKEFVDSFVKLDEFAKEELKPTMEKTMGYNELPSEPLMEFTFDIELEEDETLMDWVYTFQEDFEIAFEDKDYIIAGFKNFKENYEYADKKFNFDAYWVYSLCHFEFSNGVFKDRADAGVFAPCSVYMYIEKGGKKLHVGMPKLENWVNVANITDPKKVESVRSLDAEIEEVFKSLGGK